MKFIIHVWIVCSLFLSMICHGSENLESIISLDSQAVFTGSSQKRSVIENASLENLPVKLLAHIVDYLSDQVGTPSFDNKKDIPFIIENVDNLASVNKKMQKAVYSDLVTDALLLSLSHRFKMLPIDIACKLKTKRTQAWFEKYLETSDDYQMFLVVQNIFKICEQIGQQTTDYKIDMQYSMHQDNNEKNKLSIVYCPISYTQQGLILDLGKQYREEFILYTPWGKVSLFKKNSELSQKNSKFNLEAIAIQQALFQQLTASFDSIDSKNLSHVSSWYEVIRSIDFNEIDLFNTCDLQANSDLLKKISPEQIQEKNGQQVLLTSNCIVNSSILYKIHAVQDRQLPDPEMAQSKEYRRYNARKALWKAMDNKFHERLPKVSLKSSPCKNKFENLSSVEYPAPYEEHPSILVDSIHEVAQKYAQLAARIIALPNFESEYPCKVLPCANYSDTLIVKVLTDEINKSLLAQQRISCMTLGDDPDYRGYYVIAEQPIDEGVCLTTNYNCCAEEEMKIYALWSLDFLETHYKDVINKFQNGWKQVYLIDNQNLGHYESEEAWVLFVQSNLTHHHQQFIQSLLFKLGFSSEKIYSTYICDDSNKEDNRVFIWIKKDAMNEVKNSLGLNFSS